MRRLSRQLGENRVYLFVCDEEDLSPMSISFSTYRTLRMLLAVDRRGDRPLCLGLSRPGGVQLPGRGAGFLRVWGPCLLRTRPRRRTRGRRHWLGIHRRRASSSPATRTEHLERRSRPASAQHPLRRPTAHQPAGLRRRNTPHFRLMTHQRWRAGRQAEGDSRPTNTSGHKDLRHGDARTVRYRAANSPSSVPGISTAEGRPRAGTRRARICLHPEGRQQGDLARSTTSTSTRSRWR